MTESDLVLEARALLAKTSYYAKLPMIVSHVDKCEIQNFECVRPEEFAPVAYLPDRADAALFARAPALLSAMADEIERLHKHIADLNHDLDCAVQECNERHG